MEDLIYDEGLRQKVADNLVKYRKLNGLTQLELSKSLQYSDKNISKWERGEALPDLIILKKLSELYKITIDDFFSSDVRQPSLSDATVVSKHRTMTKKQILICLLSVGLVWLVATILFSIFHLFFEESAWPMWQVFIIAIPISFIVALVFTSLWCTNLMNCIMVGLLIWSVALCFDICVPLPNTFIIYIVAIPIQLLDILWFSLRKLNKLTRVKKKDTKSE